jgi:hypothetical protein
MAKQANSGSSFGGKVAEGIPGSAEGIAEPATEALFTFH